MTPSRFSVFLTGAVLVGIGLLLGCTDSNPSVQAHGPSPSARDSVPDGPVFKIRSVTLDARRRPDPQLLRRLRALGVTHITLVSFGWQRAADDPRVKVDTAGGWYSESHRGIRSLARQADTLGMDVILKPHIWIGGYDEAQSRSEIGFEDEAAWTRWEDSYRQFLLLYARLAADVQAEVLVLGTELSSVATGRPDYWRGLADTVRGVYDGKLTYAANWHEEYRRVDFWDALDYVGVQAYFPLADRSDPSLDTLQARWRSHRAALEQIHHRTGKPVLLTEVGYRSAPSAAETPWRWPERDGDVPTDSTLQARCYHAFFSTMARAPWLVGAIIWKWHPRHASDRPTGFTPQGKPAERVLYRWFTGRRSPEVPVRSMGTTLSSPS